MIYLKISLKTIFILFTIAISLINHKVASNESYITLMFLYDNCIYFFQNVATNKYKCTIIDSSLVKEIIPQSSRKQTNSIRPSQSTVICTNGKRYGCQKVILCAGPWTNKLINMLS